MNTPKQISLKIPISTVEEDFYLKYLHSIKGILGDLTDTDITVIAAIFYWKNKLESTNGLSQEDVDQLLFSAEFRKKIRERVNMSPQNLNNYIKRLTDKGVLKYDSNKKQYFLVGSIYFPIVNLDEVSVKFNFTVTPSDNDTQTL